MGDDEVNWLHTTVILVAAFLLAFLESGVNILRQLLGAQIDLLPVLMVYTGLTAGPRTVALAAVFSGLWFDSLSANPLGISIIPLFLIGLFLLHNRELVLREQAYAQFLLGLMACAFAPICSVLLLMSMDQNPLLGWGSIWQLMVMALGGGALTPVCFLLLDRTQRLFSYPSIPAVHYQHDREIKRGRF